MSSGTTKTYSVLIFWHYAKTLQVCVAQTEASFSCVHSFHLSSLRCVRVSMSNGLHKTRGHKHPWVYWQLSRTLFVLYSLSRALFTALFTGYRSHSGSVLLVRLRLRCSQQRPVLTNLNWIRVTSRPLFIALFWPNTYYVTFYSPWNASVKVT